MKPMRISRREFLKKAGLVSAGIVGTALSLNYILSYRNILPVSNETTIDTALMKEAMFYERLKDNTLRCATCPNRCVIDEEKRGICWTRINIDEKIYSIVYGKPCAVHVDPIEKKPLFHFLTKSNAFSIATAGCCLRCDYCQNWQISQAKPEDIPEDTVRGIISQLESMAGISAQERDRLNPEDIAKFAGKLGCKSIAYTYTEPTIFYEYMYDTSRIAMNNEIKNLIVTCGYINEDPLNELCKYLDGGNVNLKGFSDEFYKKLTHGYLQPILDTMEILKERKKWFEITYLVIPGWSDDEQIDKFIKWVVDNLGVNYPIHFLRFSPAYKMKNVPPTPPEILEKARNNAIKEGINYVYIGNVPGSEGEHTYCPSCRKILIRRYGFIVIENNIINGGCKFCGKKIPGVWG